MAVKCIALRGIKVIEDEDNVWKVPGDELVLERAEAEDLREGGYLDIVGDVEATAPAAEGENQDGSGSNGSGSRRGK